MPRKSGTISKRGDKKYLVRVYVGPSQNGTNKYVNKTVKGTLKDAQSVLNKMLRAKDLGESLEASPMTVKEYLEHWLEVAAKPRLAASTLETNTDYLNRYLIKLLGRVKLQKLNPSLIQKAYSDMLTRGLSPATVLRLHATFSDALKQAVKWRMLNQNPCQFVDLPKVRKSEMSAMDEEEVANFLEAARQDAYYVLFALMLGTGLRPGEALPLMWKDVDVLKQTLTVQRATEVVKGKLVSLKDPKTKASRRNIKLSEHLVLLLLNHRDKQPFLSDLIFPSLNDTPLNERNVVNRHFNPILKRLGFGETVIETDKNGRPKERFKPRFRFYDLRHTHATLLFKAGVHPKIVSERLGHASIKLTLDTYSHVLPGMQDEAASKLDTLLFKKAEDTTVVRVTSN